jgi:hypothetical protein
MFPRSATQALQQLEKTTKSLFFTVKHDNILFTLLATSFGHQTIISPSIHKI